MQVNRPGAREHRVDAPLIHIKAGARGFSQSALGTMKTHPCTFARRRFLQDTAAAGLAAPYLLRSSLKAASPNGKLNHACIGVGGMGWVDLQNFQQHSRVQIVALCDVDANSLKRAADKVPGARTYTDWRELLDKEGDKIDSVNVAVPDHSHFPIAMKAILLGTVAIRVPDQKLDWDAPRMKFPNHPEAERFLRRKYRDGWEVHPV